MTTFSSLSFNYAVADSDADAPWLNLEQKDVASNRLSANDLQVMLGMVESGISARAYLQDDCPANIAQGIVSVDLLVWAWPSTLGLDYSLVATLGTFSERIAIQQEREFNLAINFSETIELPFYCTLISWDWTEIPCFDKYGNEVDRPELVFSPTNVRTPGDIFTVIRVRCLANGYAHPLTIEVGKAGSVSITDVESTVQAIWRVGEDDFSESLDLVLPTCAEQLLAACDDESVAEKTYGSVSDDDEEKVPVLYYNGCTGKMMVVRYE